MMNAAGFLHRHRLHLACLAALLTVSPLAQALQFHTSHRDPVAPVIIDVTTILFVALLAAFVVSTVLIPVVPVTGIRVLAVVSSSILLAAR